MDNVSEYYKEFASKNFLVRSKQPMSHFFHGLRMDIDQNMGQGCTELLHIHNGLYVSLTDYYLYHRLETCHKNAQIPFQLAILLSGHAEFQVAKQTKQTFDSGDIWFGHGSFEQILRTQFPNEHIRGFSMYLPQKLIEAWLDSYSCTASRGLEKLMLRGAAGKKNYQQAFPLVRGLQHSSGFMRIARELIYTKRQTLADNLRFESLALDLLSRILTMEDSSADSSMEQTRKTRAAVDEAVDILRHEWNDPPNISTLARRVGVNESYLKEWFRQQTGMTIGEYIREQRMKKALEMIETSRYSILKTSLFVGYSNPSHFSAAFKKFYGHLPSYYLPRSGRTS